MKNKTTRKNKQNGQRARKLGAQTQAIHAGEGVRHGVGGPVSAPICRTSTFTFSSTAEMKRWAEGKSKAYIYTRYGNPSLAIAEGKIAALEGAEAAVVTASGMAAISHALLSALKSGDEVISTAQVYGGTYRLMRDVFPNMGIKVHQAGTDLAGIEALVTPRTKVLYVETPTNPTVRLVDLQKAIAFAKKHKLISIIDNTFATPVLQQPHRAGVRHGSAQRDQSAGRAFGCDCGSGRGKQVLDGPHPAHGDLPGRLDGSRSGVSVESRDQDAGVAREAAGRERHRGGEISGEASRRWRGCIIRGWSSHPDHKLAKRQMRGFGSMLAFDLKGGLPAARKFCDRVRLFLLAASLGGVESLVVLPAYTSHYNMTRGGVGEGLRDAGDGAGFDRD